MQVTNKIKMDLTRPDPTLTVHAVQGEAYSRSLQIALFREHEFWTIPEDVTVNVRYAKPDRTKGCYDTLPDGTSAWSAQGNLLTVHLAPQMLTVPGSVKAQIQLVQGSRILSTFSLTIFVEADPAAGTMRSENYINWLQWVESQAQYQVNLTQQSAEIACQASQAAAMAAENAAYSSSQTSTFSDSAKASATQSQKAAEDAATAQKETEAIAGKVSSIVAGNEAYTKEESDLRYCPAIANTAIGWTISLTDSAKQKLADFTLFGRTHQTEIPTPETPAELIHTGSGGNVNVTVAGKNLLINDIAGTYVGNGTTYELTPNMCIAGGFLPNTQYTLSVHYTLGNDVQKSQSGRPMYFKIDYTDGTTDWEGFEEWQSSPFVYISRPDKTLNKIAFTRHLRWTGGTITIHDSQIELGAAKTDYEPCKDLKTLTVSTPNGLPGIPVTSGGNYTDETGQRWICNSVDFSRGVYVQRVTEIVFDGSEDEEWFTNGPTGVGLYRIGSAQYEAALKPATAVECSANALCSSFEIDSASNTWWNAYDRFTIDHLGHIYVIRSTFTSESALLADWRSYLQEKPMTILAELATSIEMPLSTEELDSYATLHTHYPNTTILNDGDAGMVATYFADIKRYIQHRILELST